MGGHIDVASEYSIGSTFTCVLQFESAPDDLAHSCANPVNPAVDSAAENPNMELKALIVDDNMSNRMLASMILEKTGCRCEEAESGEQAAKLCLLKSYDFILMDVRLPDIDGFEVTRRIRAHTSPSARRPFIIALTAQALVGDKQKCLSAGMDAYLSKPYDPDLLISVIRTAFASRHPRK